MRDKFDAPPLAAGDRRDRMHTATVGKQMQVPQAACGAFETLLADGLRNRTSSPLPPDGDAGQRRSLPAGSWVRSRRRQPVGAVARDSTPYNFPVVNMAGQARSPPLAMGQHRRGAPGVRRTRLAVIELVPDHG